MSNGGAPPLSTEQEQRARRGEQAGALLEHGVFARAVAAVAARYADEARTAKSQEEAWQAILRARALGDVIQLLRAQVADGRAAEAEAQRSAEPELSSAEAITVGREDYVSRATAARREFLARLHEAAQHGASESGGDEAQSPPPGEGDGNAG